MPLLWLSLAFLAGIAAASFLQMERWFWLASAGIALLAFLVRLILKRKFPSASPGRSPFSSPALPSIPIPYPLLFLVFLLGAYRFQISQPAAGQNYISEYAGGEEKQVIEGRVLLPPVHHDRTTSLVVNVEKLRNPGGETITEVRGSVRVSLPAGSGWRYGDVLRLEGVLELPEDGEDFSYREYLAGQGIYAVLVYPRASLIEGGRGNPVLAWIYDLRENAVRTLYRLYPDPEASLLAGILLGVEAGIPENVMDAFRKTGTSHVIVISGFNVSIIAGLFFSGANRLLGRWRGFAAAVLGIAFYTILVGAGAPVLRAAIMGSLTLGARQVGRRQDPYLALFFTAALMALFDPDILASLSFQLSFLATFGMVVFAGPWTEALKNFLEKHLSHELTVRLTQPVSEYFLVTLAAQAFTLPLILYHFGQLSSVSFIVNPIILPAQPPVMVLGGLSAILGMLVFPLGKALSWLAWLFPAYTIRMVEIFARFTWANIAVGQAWIGWLWIYYGAICLWLLKPEILKRLLSRLSPAVPALVLGGLAVYVWGVAYAAPDGRLQISVLNVTAGAEDSQAVLVETPAGRRLLIGGGASSRSLSDALGRRLRFRRNLDWLVIPSVKQDRIRALPAFLERYPPGEVLWAAPACETRACRDLRETLDGIDAAIHYPAPGQKLDLGSGAFLQVTEMDKNGAGLLVEWNRFRMFLPASVSESSSVKWATVVLLPNGSNPGAEWIGEVNPWAVIVSGAEEKPGVEGDRPVLTTDQNGWFRLSTDGERLWVEEENR